jgi:hypothetical protein
MSGSRQQNTLVILGVAATGQEEMRILDKRMTEYGREELQNIGRRTAAYCTGRSHSPRPLEIREYNIALMFSLILASVKYSTLATI